MIDGCQTILYSAHGMMARGSILLGDLTLKPCYVAKAGASFAHGDTMIQALREAHEKELERMPIEKRISEFVKVFPETDEKLTARQLYQWHHTLTGSCTTGRDIFVREHEIDLERDTLSVREFISLTKDAYGGDAIRKLAAAYGIKLS